MCVHPLQMVVLLHTSLYSTLVLYLYFMTVVQYLYFKPRMSGSKHKSRSDVAGMTVLFRVLYCKIKNFFVCVWSFTYYLCERYYKPITVQCHIVICVSWVSRLTLLDLPTNWTYKLALRTELIHM